MNDRHVGLEEQIGSYDGWDDYEILIDIQILHKTDEAVLIKHKNKQAWFPKSTIITLEKDCIEYTIQFNPEWLTTRMTRIEGDF